MVRTDLEKNTLDYYNLHASEFRAFRGEGVSSYWSDELNLFQELLPSGILLEVGCGVGNEAVLLKERGYEYVGIDNSIGMLSVAKSRSPEIDFVCQDFRTLNFSSSFDGLIAIASLLHLEKEQLLPVLKSLKKQLRPGGIGLFTLKEGKGTEVDNKGRFYTYYSEEELSDMFTSAGYILRSQTIHEEIGHSFICCFVENPIL